MSAVTDLVDTHYRGLTDGDAGLAASIFAPDARGQFPTGEVAGREGLQAVAQTFITAFPGMTIERLRTWVTDDGAVAEIRFAGMQTGPLVTPDGEVPPSGRTVSFPLVDTFVVRDGSVVEHHVYWDNVSFLGQLGLIDAEG